MANRVGRPRSVVDSAEILAGFSRLPLDEREVIVRCITALHEVLPEPLPPMRRAIAPQPEDLAETASSEVTQR